MQQPQPLGRCMCACVGLHALQPLHVLQLAPTTTTRIDPALHGPRTELQGRQEDGTAVSDARRCMASGLQHRILES